LGGVQGQASDIEIEAQEIIRIKNLLTGLIAKHTGQNQEKVIEDSDRNKWMSADQALDYGLVDKIMKRDGKKS
jgi:ATP-dependent Clp protease protease subunit